ncbi:MAG: C-type lectin domain-containing protein, partial [Deltaproteobacteria bacterium]|nr:C-type lectin domain-containing protein [Deltaproteobacteria bacterium]
TGADALSALSMPALTDVVALRLSMNRALASLDFGGLQTVRDDLTIAGNPALSRCTAGRLWVSLTTRPPHTNLSANQDRTCGQSDLCAQVSVPEITNGKVFQCIDQASYAKQESGCAGLGGYLLWFESASEWSAVRARFASKQLPESWVGYSDAASEGQWRATSGFTGYDPTASSGFWMSGEPGNAGGSEDCAVAGAGGAYASDCSIERPRVCRVPMH